MNEKEVLINQKVHLNYFQMIFRKEFNELAESFVSVKLGIETLCELTRHTDIYATFPYQDKRLEFYNIALVHMGTIFCDLTNTEIKSPQTWNAFVYIQQIINTISTSVYPTEIPGNKKVGYIESFLWSLEMICKDYFLFLEKGDVTLVSSKDSEMEEKSLDITLNSSNKMIQCEAVNMDMKESASTFLRVLALEKNNQMGPVPNVSYRYRKDI